MARLAYNSLEFWTTHAPYSSATLLNKRYPRESGGLSVDGWYHTITRAKRSWPDLAWAESVTGRKLPAPDVWPPALYDNGVEAPADVPATVELTTAEKIDRDREVKRLKQDVSQLRAKLDASYTDSEIEERICAHIDRCIPALNPAPIPQRYPKSGNTAETAVALFSDYHIGEVVDYEGTGGLNAYNREIFETRLTYHTHAIASICRDKLTGYEIDELVIIGLGDMVSGIIHDELVETSDGDLMDWLIDGSNALAHAFRHLAAEFPAVRIEWHYGNHGRTTQKPRFKRRWVNYDYLLGHMISRELRDQPNITFTNHKSFWSLVPVQGHNILALHGDNIKGWNGIPLYGVNRAVGNLTALLSQKQKSFDLVTIGHFHQSALLERMDCDVVLNGSAIGGNEFSYGALFAGNKPRQTLFGVHPKRGKTWLYQLDLSEADNV